VHSWRLRQRGALITIATVITITTLAGIAQAVTQPLTPDATHPAAERCDGSHWVAAWVSAPQSSSLGLPDDTELGLSDGHSRTFEDQTLRMIVAPRIGGSAVRVHLSNRFGTAPLTIDAATIGLRISGASLAPATIQTLTFGGDRGAVVAAGDAVVSDPIEVDVHPFEPLAVSFHVVGSAAVDYHQWAQATHYAAPAGSGDHADDASGAAFTEELTSSYGVTAVDVLAPTEVGAVVAVGDSITDGIGSSPNTNRRWTDGLARRVLDAAVPVSVVNAGIGGNRVAPSPRGIGPSAAERVEGDALDLAGVTDVFVFEGINDIHMAGDTSDVVARVIAGYRSIIENAREAGVRVTGSTITPAGLLGEKEVARRAINGWIRGSGAFDAIVDFDAVARDPSDHSQLRPAFDAGLAHLTDDGYLALANAVDLSLFQRTGCGA
jgi:lysophospholipase L1-like esterase